ncbi:peptidylprolyl isomerase [Parasulfuritortus cantonensis]|nr:peptidylprolyl isomerase [Parasulfuritortus cantonensis]
MRLRLLALLAFAATATPALAADSDVIARMGDVSLKVSDARQLADRLPASERNPQILERLIRTELVRRSVAAEARKQGFDRKPEVAARMDQAAEQALVGAYVGSIAKPPADYPPDSLVRQAYDASKDTFTLPKRYQVSQIYVTGTDAKAKAKADDLYRQASARNADFAAVARKSSQHAASAARGGDMGWLAEKDMLPAVAGAVAALKKNEVGKPVLGPAGYHILRVTDSKAPELLPLDKVRPAIVQSLRLRRAKEIEASYLDGLAAKTPIAVDGIGLSELAKGK